MLEVAVASGSLTGLQTYSGSGVPYPVIVNMQKKGFNMRRNMIQTASKLACEASLPQKSVTTLPSVGKRKR